MANQDHRGGSGNFADDPKRASEAGKKGGQHSHGAQQSQSGTDNRQQGGAHQAGQSGQNRGGSGNFAEDRERASEAGRKGGER